MNRNSWRIMWVIAMFDLPTNKKDAVKAYTQFRNRLLEEGFSMMQFSVYQRHFPTYEKAKAYVERISKEIPSNGKVSFLFFTDKQYGLTRNFFGKKELKTKTKEEQFLLF